MEWTQVLAIIASNLMLFVSTIGMFIWSYHDRKKDTDRLHIIIQSIADEMKNFHKKLCEIESERNKILSKK